MNSETELKTDKDESPAAAPTPPAKGESLRAKMIAMVSDPALHGCYVMCGVDAPEIGGANFEAADLLDGFDYVVVPVKRNAQRPAGLGWVKFK